VSSAAGRAQPRLCRGVEPRRWYWLRLESIGYTLIAAVASLLMAFLIVLGPLIIEAVRRFLPLAVLGSQ